MGGGGEKRVNDDDQPQDSSPATEGPPGDKVELSVSASDVDEVFL